MNSRHPWLLFKRLLLLFWAVWLSLAVASNMADGLKAMGVLPESFRFASGNYQAIIQVTAPFGLPVSVVGFLFVGVILWEGLSMLLFWYMGLTFQGAKDVDRQGLLVLTFAISLGLWAAFQIACEAFPSALAYQIAGVHRLLFTAQLATLLAVVLLPDD